MTSTDQNTLEESPTMAPRQGPRSSSSLGDRGIKMGKTVLHPAPLEWGLEHIPDSIIGPVRRFVAKGMRIAGSAILLPENELQEAMNGKIFMNTVDASNGKSLFEEVPEGYLKSLFPQGKEDEWPTQLIMCTKDIRPDPAYLRKIMLNLQGIIGDVLESPLQVVEDLKTPAKEHVVVVGVYNTEKDVLNNAAAVLERVETIRRDPLSLDHITHAAVSAGEALLDIATLRKDGNIRVLRSDSESIFRHVMTHGFSQGGNIATDIFRYIRHELHSGNYELAMDEKGAHTVPTSTSTTVKQLLSGAHIYTIAAADIPYRSDELQEMPPRDHSRSDHDMVISAAVGTNKQQSNYGAKWSQNSHNEMRSDRLLETKGPRKKLLGRGEPDDGYYGFAGHGEDDYRTSVLAHTTELRDRWLPRFHDAVVAHDVTFHKDHVRIDFDKGAPLHAINALVETFSQAVGEHSGIAVETGIYPNDPYHVILRAAPDALTLRSIQHGLTEAGIHMADEVSHAVHADKAVSWLKGQLKHVPHLKIDIAPKEHGPAFILTPTQHFSGMKRQLQNLLTKGLERIGISTRDRNSLDGKSIEIPLEDVVSAIRSEREQRRER